MPVNDLSLIHKKVTGLFARVAKNDLQRYRLTEEQVQFFNENGYLAGIRLLEEDQINVLRSELNEIADPAHPAHELFYEFHSNESNDPNSILFHALGAWRVSGGFHDVLWNPRFLMPASQLLQNKAVRFWHDQLFCKPSKKGGVVAWHQDYSYWTRTKPVAHLTCWCALDDATIENGCVQYVPGSHRWGLLEKPSLAGDLLGVMDYLSDEQKQAFKPVPVPVKAGEAIFHHPLTMHGSGENKSTLQRRAFVINVVRDGVKSDTDEPLLQGVPVVKKGEKLDGQFFPLLFEPEEIKKLKLKM